MNDSSDDQWEPLAPRPRGNILSIDLEDWYHVSSVDHTRYLLETLSAAGVTATFFVLGTVAEREQALIRDVAAAGHEVASHGWSHEPLTRLTPAALQQELERSCSLLQMLAGARPLGFRAPCFSVGASTLWVFDALIAAGFRYDSSVFPFRGRRYGMPTFPRGPVRVRRAGGSILEVPLSTLRIGGRNWPVSGGGYFRLLPYRLIRRAMRAINAEQLPFVTYCHPYEFGRGLLMHTRRQPSFTWLGARLDELTTNLFRSTMRRKLAHLLRDGAFSSFAQAFQHDLA